MLASFFVLATLSLLQGIADIVVPVLTGAPSFGFLYEMTERFGPGFFVAYVFVHNLGLACLVPGYGFVAARFERKTANRSVIGLLLTAAVVASLLVAAEFILTAPSQFHLPTALALLVGEASGVLALAITSARELKGFVPTRAYDWSLIEPFRRLRMPLVYSVTILLTLSVWEAWAILVA